MPARRRRGRRSPAPSCAGYSFSSRRLRHELVIKVGLIRLQVLEVLVIVGAGIRHDAVGGFARRERARDRPWLREEDRVVERRRPLDGGAVLLESLDDM